MAGALPEGLVNNREDVTDSVDNLDRLEAQHVAYLWQVYSSKKTVLAENIGRRLENFFWRIWSSGRIRQRLSGQQIAIQFGIINEGGYLRTTPTPSPRSSKSLNTYYREARLRTPPPTSPNPESTPVSTLPLDAESSSSNAFTGSSFTLSNPPIHSTLADEPSEPAQSSNHGDFGSGSITPTPSGTLIHDNKESNASKENRRIPASEVTRRPPILKKSGSSGSSRSSQSVKLTAAFPSESRLRDSAETEEAIFTDEDPNLPIFPVTKPTSSRRHTATRFNEEVAVSIPKPLSTVKKVTGERSSRSSGEGSQRGGKKNPVVMASSGAGKRRPIVMRQRSLSGSPKLAVSRSLSSQNLAGSPRLSSYSGRVGSSLEEGLRVVEEPRRSRRPRSPSPHPSRHPQGSSPVQKSNKPSPQTSELSSSQEGQSPSQLTRSDGSKGKGPVVSSEKEAQTSKALVDPDFRSKFIQRNQPSQRSFTDSSLLSRKSTAAVPTAVSYTATGIFGGAQPTVSTGRGKGREAFTNVTAPLKAPAPAGPETPIADDILAEASDQSTTRPEGKYGPKFTK